MPGTYTGSIEVTYPDGTKDTVDVPVNVVDNRPDAEKTPAKGQDIDTEMGTLPPASDGIANKDDLPANTDISWSKEPDVSKPGTSTGTITVTFPDGSKQEIDVNVHVTDSRSDADKYDPKPSDQDVEQGKTPKPDDSIANKDELPDGTDYEWKDPIDTSKPGDQTGTVIVKYPDGSTDEVEVTIHVSKPKADDNNGKADGNAGSANASSHANSTANASAGSKRKGALPQMGDSSLLQMLAALGVAAGAVIPAAVSFLVFGRRGDDGRRL